MAARVHLLARPSVVWTEITQFLNAHGRSWDRTPGAAEASELVEFAGRVCYMSFGRQSPRNNCQYIGNLIDKGHESVLEHAYWTFGISNVSRGFSHQLVRHRVGIAFSQLSQQYVDHSSFMMVKPMDFSRVPGVDAAWEAAEFAAQDAYRKLKSALEGHFPTKDFSSELERTRLINGVARQILPNAVSTSIVATANARALRHFLSVRGGIEGDPEMRDVCVQLLRLLKREAPEIFQDLEIRDDDSSAASVVQI